MINENKVRVIGKYINNSGNRMLVISSLDGSFMKILNYSEFRKTQKMGSNLSIKPIKQEGHESLEKDILQHSKEEDIVKYIDDRQKLP